MASPKKIEINNYDVLVESAVSSGGGDDANNNNNSDSNKKHLRLYNPPNIPSHVGNNRFSVMLTMHRSEYEGCLNRIKEEEKKRQQQNDEDGGNKNNGNNDNDILDQGGGGKGTEQGDNDEIDNNKDSGEDGTAASSPAVVAAEAVVQRIVNIVCRQCVPTGRFLVRLSSSPVSSPRENNVKKESDEEPVEGGGNNTAGSDDNKTEKNIDGSDDQSNDKSNGAASAGWVVLPESQVQEFVKAQLVELVRGNNNKNGSNQTNVVPEVNPRNESVSMSSMTAIASKDPLISDKNGEDEDDDMANGDKKRPRRRSLLRRSVSESILGVGADKKKFLRMLEEHAGDSSNSSSAAVDLIEPIMAASKNGRLSMAPHSSKATSLNQDGPPIFQLETLDVLFDSPMNGLVVGQPGNNRISVLMDVQTSKYKSSTSEGQITIVKELMKTVCSFWGGRFLCERESSSTASDGTMKKSYTKVSDEQAEMALRGVFACKMMGGSGLVPPVAAAAPAPPSSTAPATSATSAPLERQVSRPSIVKKSTLEALNQFQLAPDLCGAAVESLQKRKKRQGLTSKIRTLTANTQTAFAPSSLASSQAPPPPLQAATSFSSQTSLTRSTSEPVRNLLSQANGGTLLQHATPLSAVGQQQQQQQLLQQNHHHLGSGMGGISEIGGGVGSAAGLNGNFFGGGPLNLMQRATTTTTIPTAASTTTASALELQNAMQQHLMAAAAASSAVGTHNPYQSASLSLQGQQHHHQHHGQNVINSNNVMNMGGGSIDDMRFQPLRASTRLSKLSQNVIEDLLSTLDVSGELTAPQSSSSSNNSNLVGVVGGGTANDSNNSNSMGFGQQPQQQQQQQHHHFSQR